LRGFTRGAQKLTNTEPESCFGRSFNLKVKQFCCYTLHNHSATTLSLNKCDTQRNKTIVMLSVIMLSVQCRGATRPTCKVENSAQVDLRRYGGTALRQKIVRVIVLGRGPHLAAS
jgi:hypothetical protein